MFGVNKDMMIMVAVFIALATCFYLFNENKRNKAELASVKTLFNSPQPQIPVPTPTQIQQQVPRPSRKKPEPEPEPESEE
jgi:hypothetical protein